MVMLERLWCVPLQHNILWRPLCELLGAGGCLLCTQPCAYVVAVTLCIMQSSAHVLFVFMAFVTRLDMVFGHKVTEHTLAYLQIPTVGFLYIAGYIGYVGRDYIKSVKSEKKPTEKEIIIDVPFAIKLAFQGIGWPFRAIQELRAGTLTEDDSKITVSPR